MLNDNDAKRDFSNRIVIISIVITLLCCILIGRLYVLQVLNAKKYQLLSDKNRIRVIHVVAKRGKIITADNAVIASNKNRYKLVIESNRNKSIFMNNFEKACELIQMDDEEIANIIKLNAELASYNHIVVKDSLSWDEYSILSMKLFRLTNVFLEKTFLRQYEMPLEFSHVTGYITRSTNALKMLVGVTGVEMMFDNYLKGTIGNTQAEINSFGKKIRILEGQDPIGGDDINITIDSRLQKYVYDLLLEEKAGACIVIDLQTEQVLSLVSVPGFDTNILSTKMSKEQWNAIINDPLLPLMNRATKGAYPPGSIFKIVVAYAALAENIISQNDKIYCCGGTKLDDHTFHCWNRGGHGHVDVKEALCSSCDCYFYDVAMKLGIDKIAKYAKQFGFGEKTGIEIFNEGYGLLPSKKWKLDKYKQKWKPYETLLIGIGQGSINATLMQSAVMMCRLYSGNMSFTPTIIQSNNRKSTNNAILKDVADVIKDGLYKVCNSPQGTAYKSCCSQYGIYGKTGSSQIRRMKKNEVGISQAALEWNNRDHAFFIGAAPREPRYVVAVFVEHGGGGASKAAPLARKILDKLMWMQKNETKCK